MLHCAKLGMGTSAGYWRADSVSSFCCRLGRACWGGPGGLLGRCIEDVGFVVAILEEPGRMVVVTSGLVMGESDGFGGGHMTPDS